MKDNGKEQSEISQKVTSLLDPRLELLRMDSQRAILSVKENLSTPVRGKLLLDTEKMLRQKTGQPIEVYLEPRGDINKLRQQLRGVSLDGSRDSVFSERYENEQSSESGVNDKDE
jgi:hypothetical protein